MTFGMVGAVVGKLGKRREEKETWHGRHGAGRRGWSGQWWAVMEVAAAWAKNLGVGMRGIRKLSLKQMEDRLLYTRRD